MTEKHQRILYVCSQCAEDCPEGCGHSEPTELRVMADGRWLCDGCYDEERKEETPPWRSLPMPPAYVPSDRT